MSAAPPPALAQACAKPGTRGSVAEPGERSRVCARSGRAAGARARGPNFPKRISWSDENWACALGAPMARPLPLTQLLSSVFMLQYVPVFANSSHIFFSVASCDFNSGFALIAAISALKLLLAKPCRAASKSTILLRGTLSM